MKNNISGEGTIERPAGSGSSGDINFYNYHELRQIAIAVEKATSIGEKTTIIRVKGNPVEVYKSKDGSEVILKVIDGNYIRLPEGYPKLLTENIASWLPK
jgi:hypothetical protein